MDIQRIYLRKAFADAGNADLEGSVLQIKKSKLLCKSVKYGGIISKRNVDLWTCHVHKVTCCAS